MARLEELFVKVGSFYPRRENFRLTEDVQARFTRKSGTDPEEFFGAFGKRCARTVFGDGVWGCSRLSGTDFRPDVRGYSETGNEADSDRLSAAARQWIFELSDGNGSKDDRLQKESQKELPKELPKEKTGRTYQSIRLPEAREHVRRAGQFVLETAEEYQPVVHRAFSLRRKIGTILAAALAVWLFFHVVLGANGALAYGNKRNEYRTLQKDVDQLQEQNEQLRKHIEALKGDPAAIEREAREQLHYAKPGEIVYVAPAPPPPPMPRNHSAKR